MDGKPEKALADVNLMLAPLPQPANDSRPVFERLRDYASRGTDSPESLSLSEIRQIAFALALLLSQEL